MTPHAYQTKIRIRRAKSLLHAGLPITAVAAEAGFYDQAHLTRHFKRIVGLTPGRYLKDAITSRFSARASRPRRSYVSSGFRISSVTKPFTDDRALARIM